MQQHFVIHVLASLLKSVFNNPLYIFAVQVEMVISLS